MRTRPAPLARVIGLVIPVLGVLATACGGASTHADGTTAGRQSQPSSTQQTSFLRKCGNGVGAGALGDASVCQCTLAQLQAETNAQTFAADIVAWESDADGTGLRSKVAQTIARCSGHVGRPSGSADAVATRSLPPPRTVKLSNAEYGKKFRWSHSPQSMDHTCLNGTAVANGMSCPLAQAIGNAFGEYPDSRSPVVRYLRLVDPDTGKVVSVDCAVSGRQDVSAVCNAPRHQIALLPPPDFSS